MSGDQQYDAGEVVLGKTLLDRINAELDGVTGLAHCDYAARYSPHVTSSCEGGVA